MESSVMSSWITEAGLSVQALAKKARKTLTPKTKLAATKEVIIIILEYVHVQLLSTVYVFNVHVHTLPICKLALN